MCKVCKEFLTSKAASLGKTANKAVYDFDLELDHQESDEDDSDDESLEEVEGESSLNEATNSVENLVSKVKAWHRFEGSVS